MTWKPDLPHRSQLAPGACMCAACRVKVRALRCPFRVVTDRCGDYRGHRGHHTRLIATAFLP